MDSNEWYVVRVETDDKTHVSAFSHYDDARAYMDEVWANFKEAKRDNADLRCHAYIDIERTRPPEGEFTKAM